MQSQKEKLILAGNGGVMSRKTCRHKVTTLTLTLSQWDCQNQVVWRVLYMDIGGEH